MGRKSLFARRVKRRAVRKLQIEPLEPRYALDGSLAQLVGDAFELKQNGSQVALDVLANDTFDSEYTGARLITSVSYGSEGGRLEIAADRKSVLYTPPADFFGTETFVYAVDGVATAQVQVSLQSPLSADEFNVLPSDVDRALDVLANDPFWTGYQGARKITSVSVGSLGGTIAIGADGKSIRYTPPSDLGDLDSYTSNYGSREVFTYVVDDLYAAQVGIDIAATVWNDSFEMIQNTSINVDLLANDPFWAGYTGARQITHVLGVSEGASVVVSSDGRSVHYTPKPGTSGSDSFRYVVDGKYEATATARIYRPVQNDSFEVDRNSTGFFFNVTANDRYWDANGIWRDVIDRVTSVTQSANGGTVSISADGRGIVYTPAAGFSGSDSFTYIADDLHEATVQVQVTRPVRDDWTDAIQDTANVALGVLANDFIGNGYAGGKLITSVGATQNGGTISIRSDGKSILYTPAPGFVGEDRFTYVVDGDLEASVSVYVRPLATADSYNFAPDARFRPYTLSVLSNDLFKSGYTGPGVITSAEVLGETGSVTIESGSYLRFVPTQAGSHQVRYIVDGQYEATAAVWIVNHLNSDQIVVDENSSARQFDLLTNDFINYPYAQFPADNYVGARRITGVSQSQNGGTVTVSADGRSVSYEPADDFYGADSFTYTVDGFMTATVSVNVIRRVRDDSFRVDATDGTQVLPVLVNDLFGANYAGVGRITSVTGTSAGGTAMISADGKSIVYTPAAGFVGTETFTYKVDGALTAEVSVVVDSPRHEQLPQFGSVEEYAQFLIDDALARYSYMFGQTAWQYVLYNTTGGYDTVGVPRSHSETNVQVAGVDEGDLVEFDSDYVYTLTDSELVIANAWPAEELSIASRFDVEGRPIAQFLHGDRLTIISEVGGGYDWYLGGPIGDSIGSNYLIDSAWWPGRRLPSSTIVTVLDVSNREAPTVVQTTTMEGKYVDSRGVGDFVYVLVDNFSVVGAEPQIIDDDQNPSTPGRYETKEEYTARVLANAGEFVEQVLPSYSTYGADGELVRTGLLNGPEDVYRPLVVNATNLISVVSFNVESDEPGLTDTSAVYSTGASAIYASLDNFYVFDRDYSSEDGALTRIVKFDWDPATGGVDFAASTTVPGTILNQFSADEHGDYLRIATTVSNNGSGNWSGRDENMLFVLREDDGVFEFVGSLQNLALNETMRSVRFLGDRAFVTTFRTIDPLFAIDLSDAARPEAVGHITLPGFTSYMQLIDENHLLTVGRNTPNGASGPTQVSLFNISDLAQPRRIAEYTFERFSVSEAEVDHHAFGYFAEHDLLAMPTSRSYYVRVDTDGDGYRESREAVVEYELAVFRVDASASDPTQRLQLATEIVHDSPVRRSGYIGDKLYSIANDSVKVVDVAAPETLIAELDIRPVGNVVTPVLWPTLDRAAYGSIVGAAVQFPIVPAETSFAATVAKARRHLAKRVGEEAGAPLLVSAEAAPNAPGGGFYLVFRVDGVEYLYRASDSGHIQFVEEHFEFESAGSAASAWHAVEVDSPAPPAAVDGDFDLDGRVTNSDYARWVQSFGTVSLVTYHAADGNGDGVVNAADYTLWSANLGRIAADFDGDGAVGEGDYEFWKSNFGATAGPGLAADGNGDGRVDAADFTVWRNAANVPAPPATSLAVALAFASEATEEESPRSEAVESRSSLPTTREPQIATARVASRLSGFDGHSQRASVSRTRQGFVLSERVATVRETGLLLALDRHLRELADAEEVASPSAFDQAMELLEAGCDAQLAAAQVGEPEFASVR